MNFKTAIFYFCLVYVVQFGTVHPADEDASANSVQNEELDNATRRAISKGMIMLSMQFDYLLAHAKLKEENVLFAPVNIVKTLATVMLGTSGETEIEIARALGWASGTDVVNKLESAHEILGRLLIEMTKFPGTELGVNLNIAGGVFVQKGHQIRKRYMELAQSIYQTEVLNVDFAGASGNATRTVNQWVSNKTMGRIKELLSQPVSTSTLVLVAGVLYFNGNWEYPFQKRVTKWQTFYLGSEGKASKESVQVEMMVNSATIPYYEDHSLGFQAIGIPYKGKDIYLYILLPKLNLKLINFTTLLSYVDIENVLKKSKETEVMYVIPKMKLNSKINLSKAMKKLSVRTLFDPIKANFSNLADGIYADEILHQVEIEMDEVGTIGSAATAVVMTRAGINIFRADRPFLFFMYNVRVNMITFWASVFKPEPYK